MEINLDHVLVFKTNIDTICANCELYKSLNSQPGILQWNIDHEDCDRVLRIVSETLSNQQIITLLNTCGFECSALL